MNITGKFNDIVFAIIFIYHLATRQWPYGGTLQTVLDVTLGICFLLICFKYFVFCAELKKVKPDKKLDRPAGRKKRRRNESGGE